MASLQARHSRACVHKGRWTSATREALAGCTCRPAPMLYAVQQVDGRMAREKLGRNRRDAERALDKIRGDVATGVYVAPVTMTVSAWLDEWDGSLRRAKESTRRSYQSTVGYLRSELGMKRVRDVDVADAARFLATLEKRKRGTGENARPISASTVAKHARVASACFEAARRRGLTGRNAFRDLDASQKPRPAKRESGYFEDDELTTILSKIDDDLYRTAVLVSLKTGLRQGELIGLTWRDVDTIGAVVHVRRTWTPHGGPVTTPKDHEKREVHITPDVVELLGVWWGECGKPGDDVLVIPGDAGGYMSPWSLLWRLRKAMKAAGVPIEHPKTGSRRGWHSLRHSYARLVLENEGDVYWLQKQLGHADLQTTIGRYGHFSDAARKRQAERLAGAFAGIA